ncbi:MAG: hypothetical protein FWF88_00795 [Peptococcaceae bacterium]|nr:hypothetical protein [Peptococcaceae bacterium]
MKKQLIMVYITLILAMIVSLTGCNQNDTNNDLPDNDEPTDAFHDGNWWTHGSNWLAGATAGLATILGISLGLTFRVRKPAESAEANTATKESPESLLPVFGEDTSKAKRQKPDKEIDAHRGRDESVSARHPIQNPTMETFPPDDESSEDPISDPP